ncbi:MAG: hypothetical protein JRN59_02255 [Nitrososphaerota archaeon]|nr:hypothetical protein [Nitrososphaerota archaeon]
MPDADGEEKLINAKLEEVDRLLEDLRRRRKELQDAKEAVTAEKKPSEKVSVAPPPKLPQSSEADLDEILQSLTWKSFKRKDGEWTFLRDREGTLREELDSAREFVDQLRKGKDIVVGKYRYTLSEDRFLNRYLAATK